MEENNVKFRIMWLLFISWAESGDVSGGRTMLSWQFSS